MGDPKLEETEKLKTKTKELKSIWEEVDAEVGKFVSTLSNAKSAATGLADAFMPGFGSVSLSSIISHAKQMSEYSAQMNRATGQAGNLTAALKEHRKAAGGMAVGQKELTEHMTQAVLTVTDFTKVNAKMRGEIAGTISKLTKLGISAAEGGKMIDNINKSLGMTTGIASKTAMDIAKVARSLGVAPAKAAKDLQASMPVLAAYGEGAIKVFHKLMAQSKATGVEMNDLLSVTKKFDTFEDAAKQTAQLNAIMGTTINSIDMLMASEEDRLKIMKQAVDATGKSWQGMGRFEKKALAAAAGFDDVSKAGKFFMGTMSELEAMEEKADPAIVAQQELNETLKKGIGFGQAMQAWLEGFTGMFAKTFMPMVRAFMNFFSKHVIPKVRVALGWISGWFTSAKKGFKETGEAGVWFKDMIGWVMGVAVAFGPLLLILGKIVAVVGSLGAIVSVVFSPWLIPIAAVAAAFVGLKDSFAEGTSGMGSWVKKDLPAFKNGFMSVWRGEDGIAANIKKEFIGIWEIIKDSFKKILDATGITTLQIGANWGDLGTKMGNLFKNIVTAIGKIIRLFIRTFMPAEESLKKMGVTMETFFGPGAVERMFGFFGNMFLQYVAKPIAAFLDGLISNTMIARKTLEGMGMAPGKDEDPVLKLRKLMGLRTGESYLGKVAFMKAEFDASEVEGKRLAGLARAGRAKGGKPGEEDRPPPRTVTPKSPEAQTGRTAAVATTTTAAADTTASGRVDEGPIRFVLNVDRERLFDVLVYPELKRQFHLA